jgi:hypothetical protein
MPYIKKGEENKLVDTLHGGDFIFEIYQSVTGEWYINTTAIDEKKKGMFYYKWTTGKTQEDVMWTLRQYAPNYAKEKIHIHDLLS